MPEGRHHQPIANRNVRHEKPGELVRRRQEIPEEDHLSPRTDQLWQDIGSNRRSEKCEEWDLYGATEVAGLADTTEAASLYADYGPREGNYEFWADELHDLDRGFGDRV